jgi:hypothetical protein
VLMQVRGPGSDVLRWSIQLQNVSFPTPLHIQHSDGTFEKLFAKGITAADTLPAAAASSAALALVEAALARVDPASVPASNPSGYAGAARAVAVSAGYLSTYFTWRAAGLAFAELAAAAPPPSGALCATARESLGNATTAIQAFAAAFPTEAAQWVVSGVSQELWSAPSFLTNTYERDMAGWLPRWASQLAGSCP